jgi:hypothetical protein
VTTAAAPPPPAGHAGPAERIALALVSGEVPGDLVADAMEALRMHNRAREVQRAAAALAAYRAGGSAWSWPATAPWAGFGDGKQSPG